MWYIYLHLVHFFGKCRQVYRTWILWEMAENEWVTQGTGVTKKPTFCNKCELSPILSNSKGVPVGDLYVFTTSLLILLSLLQFFFVWLVFLCFCVEHHYFAFSHFFAIRKQKQTHGFFLGYGGYNVNYDFQGFRLVCWSFYTACKLRGSGRAGHLQKSGTFLRIHGPSRAAWLHTLSAFPVCHLRKAWTKSVHFPPEELQTLFGR